MSSHSLFTFNEAYYLSQNPDVAAAVMAGAFRSGLAHWQAYGAYEGRTASRFFDWQTYRDNNPDLVEAGITTQSQLTAHFNSYGVHEGRIFMSPQLFDYEYYALHNPDLAAAGITSREALQQHFTNYGIHEGRVASAAIDGASYIAQNADLNAVMNAGGSLAGFTNRDQAGIWHYYNFGINEGRPLASARVDTPTPAPDPAPTAAEAQSISVSDVNGDGVYNAGDVVQLAFSEPVSTSVLAGMQLFGGNGQGTYRPVNAANGFASVFEYQLAPGASVQAGNVISVGKEYVVDQNGNHATTDIGFVLPSLPRTPPQYPSFDISINVGGDQYIGPMESSSMTGISATVTSSVIRSLLVSGMSGSQQVQETAVWNPSTQMYEFNATDFDDGVLTVLATDVYSQTRSFTLTKDTLAPSILAFSVAGPTTLSVTSSEAGSAALYDGPSLVTGTATPVASANTPTSMSIAAQSSVITASLQVLDSSGNATIGTTSVVLGTSGSDSVMGGSSTADFMFGFDGDDSIFGASGNDVIYGGADNDTLRGGAGNDSLNGGTGNDMFDYDAGASSYISGILPRFDTVDGGDGTDTIYAWAGGGAPNGADLTDADFANVTNMEAITLASGSYSASVVLGTNANTAFANGVTVTIDPATNVNSTVDGSSYMHNMTVTGAAQNDSLTGGSGADSLSGGNGNDTMNGGGGNDTLTGGGGVNTFNVDSGTDRITDLKAGDTLNTTTDVYVTLLDLTTATVSNNGIIHIEGTSADDSITGSAGYDIIDAGNGNDTINGGAGHDQLYGEDGDDTFVYTDNIAMLVDFPIDGGNGNDTIYFTTAIDTLTSGSPQGNNFHANFSSVTGVERIQLTGASSVNLGDVLPNTGFNTIITGNDNTTLRYDNAALGNITVDATALADNKTLTLTPFGSVSGTVFTVTNLRGDVDASIMGGNVSVAAASGSGFDVSVQGGSGNDSINGGAGNDSINGGAGNNQLTGGSGADVFTIANGGGSSTDTVADLALNNISDVIINNGRVEATLQGNWTATASTVNNASNLSFILRSNNAETIDLSQIASGNGYYVQSQGTGSVIGSSFGDYLSLEGATATFTGGSGADIFHSSGAMTITDLGAGSDILFITSNSSSATINATVVADWSAGGSLFNGPGSISLTSGSAGVDINVSGATTTHGWSITGSTGNEILVGNGYDDTISGAAGADSIEGGAGSDSINGGADNDTITGGAGVDTIFVGNGIDTVVFNAVAGSYSDSNLGVGWDFLQDIKLTDMISINASNVSQFSVTSNITAYATDYYADINANGYTDGDVYIRIYGDMFASFGTDYAGMQTNAIAHTIVNLSGTNSGDTLGGGVNNDTLSGGSGNDSLIGLGGADRIFDGSGQDEITAGIGADAITLFNDTERDNIIQEASDGVASTAQVFQGGVFTVGDAINFADGVDVISNFLAGSGAGADVLTIGTSVSTSLLGGAVGGVTIGWLSGNYDSGSQVFTVTANGAGADTLVLKGSTLGLGTSRTVVLAGVDSNQLVDSNFAGTDINLVPLYNLSTNALSFQGGSAASNRLYIQTAASTPTSASQAEGYIYNSSSYTTLQADANPNPAVGFSQTSVTSIDLSNLAGGYGVDIQIDGRVGASANLANVTGTSGNDNFIYANQDFGAANATVDGGSSGTDTVVFTTAAGGTIYGTSAGSGMQISNIDAIRLVAGSAGVITLAASVSNAVAVTNASTTDGATITLNTNSGSSYHASGSGIDSVTLGAAGQMVTLLGGGDSVIGGALGLSGVYAATGSGNTFTVGGGTLGGATILGFQRLNLTDSESISAATTLGLTTLTMTDNDVLTMTAAQNQFLQGSASVVGANQSVTVTTAGAITGIDGIETYNLANGTNSFTFSAASTQTAIGNGGVDTFLMRGNASAAGYNDADVYQVSSGTNNLITTLGYGWADDIVQVSAGATATGTTSGSWTAGVGSSNAGTATINVAGASGGAYTLDLHNASGAQGWILNGLGKVGVMIGSSQGDTITAGDTVYGRTVTITGGTGIDSIYGPTGSSGDNAVFNVASGAELDEDATVVGGTATDTINFTSAATDIDDTDFTNVQNVDKVQLADGGNIASFGLNAAAAGIRSITGGTGSDTIDASAMGVAVTIDAGQGDDTLVVGATAAAGTWGLGSGSNTVSLATGGSLAGASTSATGGTWNLSLANNASVTLRSANLTGGSGVQLSSIAAAGIETVTVDTTSAVLTGYTLDTTVENWNVGTVGNGNNSVTLGAVAQNVTFGSGNDSLDVGALSISGSINGGAGATDTLTAGGGAFGAATISNFESLVLTGNEDIHLANAGAVLGTTNLNMGGAYTLTATTAQNNGFTGTVTGGAGTKIYIYDSGGTVLGRDNIASYQFGAVGSTFEVNTAERGVNITAAGGSSGMNINVKGFTVTGTYSLGDAVDTITATNGANIAGVNGGLSTTASQLTLTGGMTMTAVQYADFAGHITASGSTDSITLTTVLGSAAMLDGQVETFVFANVTGNSVTTGASGQILNADALGDGKSLSLTGGSNVAVTLVDGDLSAGSATGNLTVTTTTGTNAIQTGSGNDSITGGTGVDQIDISAGGADHITLGNSANGIDVITGFSNNDVFHFAGLANSYSNDSATNYDGQSSLANAASAALVGGLGYEAVGFVYQSNKYIVIDVGTQGYNASQDALVQVIGTDLSTLSGANFNV